MNYLGHIYFSNNRFDLAVSNLFGDFIKGSHFEHLDKNIQNGIKLHREIDHYIDNHPVIKKLLPTLRSELPKVAPIAIDLYFDHLLAKHWGKFHEVDLKTHLKKFYDYVLTVRRIYPKEFEFFLQQLRRHDWMSEYYKKEGLNKMCQGVSQKLTFKNELINGLSVFNKHEKEIEKAFFDYMKEADEHFKIYNSQLLS